MKTFRYILRYSIDPLHRPEDRVSELINYCKKSKTEEVMLFFLAEEMSTGHPTMEEIKPWVNLAKKLKKQLDQSKIALSLNPWCTLYHVPRGRTLRTGQNFKLMVGETGAESPIAVCPLCSKWQKYICDLFVYLCNELNPTALWVEDDWRLHNHGELLGYGGCFCSLHLDRFHKLAQRSTNREEILKNILAPGKPHPWRKLWLDLCRESILEPARKLREAIQEHCPQTRLALMSSVPDIHSIEGRDWHSFQEILGRQPTFLIRPHHPPYTEVSPIDCPPVIPRHTLANLDGDLEIYPELEGSPRCGPYSKSTKYALYECFTAALYGSSGMTINQFDMMGNGTILDPDLEEAFATAKPMLNALRQLEINDRHAQGVRVLFSPKIARHLHNDGKGLSLNLLDGRSVIWGHTLSILGISHNFSCHIDPSWKGPYAIGGQTFRSCSNADIEQILRNPVLLDGMAAKVLVERGFGELIGIQSADWVEQETSSFAFETIHEENAKIYGVANPRMTASRCAMKILKTTTGNKSKILSSICLPDRTPLHPGSIYFENEWGGKILTLAYPFDGKHQFFMGFFNRFRRIFLQNHLFKIIGKEPVGAIEGHPMHFYWTKTSHGNLFAAFNVSYNHLTQVSLRLSGLKPSNLKLLQKNGTWRSIKVQAKKDRLEIPVSLAPLDGMFLLEDKKTIPQTN